MKKLLVELEHLPDAGKVYAGELDEELFGINEDEVQTAGPLVYNLTVRRFEGELFVSGQIRAPFKFRCVRCLNHFDYVVEIEDFSEMVEIEDQSVVDLTDALRENIVLEFPAYPKCADGGMENDCMAKSPYFGVDKQGQTGVNSSAPNENSGVWDALDKLGEQ